jgi:hypothetical protein
VIYFLQK